MHTFSNLNSNSMREIVVRPGNSIQDAINQASPGTIIRVKAGTYREALSFNIWDLKPENRNTSPARPIILISDDGPGKAVIETPEAKPAIFARVPNSVIDGFKIIGTANSSGDNAPLKIGREEGNILVRNNTIIGHGGEDIIKVFSTENLTIEGNRLISADGVDLDDSAIDIVQGVNVSIIGNIIDVGNAKAAITAKAGSNNIRVEHNTISGDFDGAISFGGSSTVSSRDLTLRSLPNSEADNIHVRNNYFNGVTARWNGIAEFEGASNSSFTNNVVRANPLPGDGTTDLARQKIADNVSFGADEHIPRGNRIENNILIGEHIENVVDNDSPNPIVMRNNETGTLRDADFLFGAEAYQNGARDTGSPTPAPLAPLAPTAPTPAVAPAPTAPTPVLSSGGRLVLQAEDANNINGEKAAVEENHAGFTGSGFVNFDNVSDSGAQWRINNSGGDNTQLTIRYANGSNDNRKMTLLVNGNSQGTINLNSTGSWGTWKDKTLNLNGLRDGNNVIRLQAANPNSGPNIDRLEFNALGADSAVQNPVENNRPAASPRPAPANAESQAMSIGEYGSSELDHNWKTITLDKRYINPVVIVSDPTTNGGDPAVVRLRRVTGRTFQMRLQEPNYKDVRHTKESVSYMVMESGDWTLADGTRISAGTRQTNRLTSRGFDSVSLNGFDQTPTVLSQVQTFNNTDWVTTRTKNQSKSQFKLAMQEEEALNGGSHAQETVGWFAVEVGGDYEGDSILQGGQTERSYDDSWGTVNFDQAFAQAPSIIAKLGSHYGSDTASLRLDDITSQSFGVRVSEEQSLDRELVHTNESISFLALQGQSGSLQGMSV